MPAAGGKPHNQAGGSREDRVRERGHHAAEQEDLGQIRGRTRGLGNGPAEIEDVFRESEAAGNGEGENNTVHGPVEVLSRHQQEQQQPQRLGELLHHRCLNGGHVRPEIRLVGELEGQRKKRLDQERDGDGHCCSPGKGKE